MTERSETGATPRYRTRLLVAYDGTDFHGFAENAGVRTVGGVLRAAVERVLGEPVEIAVAGRTDTGVHAWGQVVTFDAPEGSDLERLQRSVNALCQPELAVRAVERAPDDFHARFSAQWREYRYTVLNRPVPDPFRARTSWHVPEPLDLAVMRLACDPLVGEHDFSAFCRMPRPPLGAPPATLVRRVVEAGWTDRGDGALRFDVRANAFCHQMVRSLVGLLVEIGRHRRRAGEVLGVLRSGDRSQVGNLAPPMGLCLWAVGYPDGFGAGPT